MKPIVLNSYLTTSITLVEEYLNRNQHRSLPLNHFLKNYFKSNPKYGKRDRKVISDLVFAYFKIGYKLDTSAILKRIQVASFLSAEQEESYKWQIAQSLFPNAIYSGDFATRLNAVRSLFPEWDSNHFLPFYLELSDEINENEYFKSFFTTSAFFIRVVKEYMNEVKEELTIRNIPYGELADFPNCLRIEKQVQLNDLPSWMKGYFEIQDISSQSIGEFLNPKPGEQWWDMCAASGGKSLLLLSKEAKIKLLCSDVRGSILKNLVERIKRTRQAVDVRELNLSVPIKLSENFSGIICDAPCSGSGTWNRNPEELFFFTPEKLSYYSELQRSILNNALNNKGKSTQLFYMTCSVFKIENEKQVASYEEIFTTKKLLNFYNQGGNSLFLAKTN